MIHAYRGYNYIVKVDKLIPPLSAGELKFVAKITEIVKPGIGGPERYAVQIGEHYGETERVAEKAARAEAEVWIDARATSQRAD